MTISDRIHAINFGQTIAEGNPQEVANNKKVIEAYLGEEYAQD
jgi:branched-chain amino acid transport system ATP-binding protein